MRKGRREGRWEGGRFVGWLIDWEGEKGVGREGVD